MDIFTTQLTRVVPNTLKPDKLKVKSVLKKDASHALQAEHDHIDGHEETTITELEARKQYQPHPDNEPLPTEQADKSNLDQDKQKQQDDEQPPHHLDIYV